MASPKTSIHNKENGFSLIELLVVIGIFAILSSIGLFLSMDFYRTYGANSEVNNLVSSLTKARAQSLANIGEKEHGVHIQDDAYIVFEAPFVADATSNLLITSSSGTHPTGSGEIIFERLTGKARDGAGACPCTINLSVQGHIKPITINVEGGIDW